MKQLYTIFILFIICCLQPICAEKADSLYQHYLSQPHDKKWMNATWDLANLYTISDPERSLNIIDTLLTEAIQQKEKSFIEQCKSLKVILYYNIGDIEKSKQSFEKIRKSIPHIQNRKLAFNAWRNYIELATIDNDYEKALEEAYEMKRQAIALDYPNGEIIACTCIGMTFLNTNNIKKATQILEEALQIKGIPIFEEVNILCYLSMAYNALRDSQQALLIINKLSNILTQYYSDTPAAKERNKAKFLFLNLQEALAYLNHNKTESAKVSLNKAKALLDEQSFYSYKAMYYEVLMRYNIEIKQYKKALIANDSMIVLNASIPENMHEVSMWRAKILSSLGEYDKALEIYRQQPSIQDSLINIVFTKQIEQLNEAFQSKMLQTRDAKFRSILYLALIIGLIICVCYLTYSIWKLRQISITLKKNQGKMQELVEKTESSNRNKALFLKDISYKIRIPLNTVMGFSEILTNSPNLIDSEDLESISKSIKYNSLELQQLVNSVLDLSRLESGMMKYNLSDYSLTQICQDAIDTIKIHKKKMFDIQFSNTLKERKDIIHTDVIRLTQIIANILQFKLEKPENQECQTVKISLSYASEDETELLIEILNPAFSNNMQNNQFQSIQLEIGRLFIEHFGGTFNVKSGYTSFTYPLK